MNHDAIDTELEKAAEEYHCYCATDFCECHIAFKAGAAYRDRHPSKEVMALVKAIENYLNAYNVLFTKYLPNSCVDQFIKALEQFENSIAKEKP